jgi:hypothetical protein
MSITKHPGVFRVQDLEVKDDITLSDDATITGDVTISGDLTRQNSAYISGTASSPFTAFTSATTLADEGIIYVNGTAGALVGKLPAPVAGKSLTIVYCSTGQVEDDIGYFRLSSSAYPIVHGKSAASTVTSYCVDIVTPCAVTLYGINSKWYINTPATGQLLFQQ